MTAVLDFLRDFVTSLMDYRRTETIGLIDIIKNFINSFSKKEEQE